MEGGFLPEPEPTGPPALSEPWGAGQRNLQEPRTQQQQPWGAQPSGAAAARSAAAAAARSAAAAAGRYIPLDKDGGDGALEAQGGCSRCPSLSFNSEWLKAFGVVLCNQCRQGESLISKSTAKQQYGVSEGDLSRLGCLRRANPQKKDWQPMLLYLESQVSRAACDKYGGAEGLQEAIHAKLDAQMQARLKRKAEESRREAVEEARQERVRQRLAEAEARREEAAASASGSEVEEI